MIRNLNWNETTKQENSSEKSTNKTKNIYSFYESPTFVTCTTVLLYKVKTIEKKPKRNSKNTYFIIIIIVDNERTT